MTQDVSHQFLTNQRPLFLEMTNQRPPRSDQVCVEVVRALIILTPPGPGPGSRETLRSSGLQSETQPPELYWGEMREEYFWREI